MTERELSEKLVPILVGLNYSEWSGIRTAVEKVFSSESNKIRLSDPEAIHRMLMLECSMHFND